MSADQVRQLEGDRSNRVQGNDRTTSRSGWESSGSSRSGAGSYGGSSRSGSGSVSRPSGGAMRSGGGGGRRR
jgi:hypothetical protein